MNELSVYIDHTLLKADAAAEEIDVLCEEAIEYGFASVCVNPYYVKRAYEKLKGKVKVTSVVGFPLGANRKEVKALETKLAVEDGADEIDMVMNISAFKNRDYKIVKEDILAVKESSKDDTVLKVILETSLLTPEQIVKACEVCKSCDVDFVKTSTGFSSSGATAEDVALMKKTVGSTIGVKASGGIRDSEKARAMIEAGACRIGASSSVEIVKG